MPAVGRRQAAIKKNISGGTSAPAAAAKGPNVGQAHAFKQGVAPAQPVHQPKAQAAPEGSTRPVMPWDAQAANDEASAQRKLNNTETGLSASWLREQQAYGLEGPFADYTTNPYSQAALLQHSYNNANRGSVNSYAAQGQLYAGSTVNALNANTHDFLLSRDQLEKQYAEDFAKNQAERQAARDEYTGTINQAGWDRITAGLNEEPEAAPARSQQVKKNIQNQNQPKKNQGNQPKNSGGNNNKGKGKRK